LIHIYSKILFLFTPKNTLQRYSLLELGRGAEGKDYKMEKHQTNRAILVTLGKQPWRTSFARPQSICYIPSCLVVRLVARLS
jgi:hypothetical protein